MLQREGEEREAVLGGAELVFTGAADGKGRQAEDRLWKSSEDQVQGVSRMEALTMSDLYLGDLRPHRQNRGNGLISEDDPSHVSAVHE